MKVDIRGDSYEPDCSETCSGTDSIVTRLAANYLGSSGGGIGGGVPLAEPVKIPGDYRLVFFNLKSYLLLYNKFYELIGIFFRLILRFGELHKTIHNKISN